MGRGPHLNSDCAMTSGLGFTPFVAGHVNVATVSRAMQVFMAKSSKREPMLSPKGNKHQSGKAQHSTQYGTVTYTNKPRDGYLSPGLQHRSLAHAVGFMADISSNDDDWI